MKVKDIIIVDKNTLSGTSVFKGTRVPIKNLFDYLETGETIESFLKDFPSIKKENVIQLLEHAEKLVSSEEKS